ncbi:MAG: hypothetical protein J7K12_00505 [Thermoplasmata archaeon]|nr:hypothetical protein [Thermoplasmata archaeon]
MLGEPEVDVRNKEKKILFRREINIPSTTYATYGLYNYPAKFIPHVVAYVLENYARPYMKIFDPFAGYGTVGIVSRIYGYDYELWDLNPLLKILHKSATLELRQVSITKIINEMHESKDIFIPKWSRFSYWYHEDFHDFLFHVWGYYHSLQDDYLKTLLTIPLLKISRYFSYDDMQRQKLSKSPKSVNRVHSLLKKNWKAIFYQMLYQEIKELLQRLKEFWSLHPKKVNAIIKEGIDSLKEELNEKKDILITSPPYLQSQEYIRQAKLDLYWLGYSEKFIRNLRKLEIPYRKIEPFYINSAIYHDFKQDIKKPHLRRIFERYFWGVGRALSRLQEDINSYLFLFVGRSSMEGRPVPIDRIFIEHFVSLGWKHRITLVDTIIARRLFSYRSNPATGNKDARTTGEFLVILQRD